MTTPETPMEPTMLAEFLGEAAAYFENRPTCGEDLSHWANVYNAQNCRQAAALIRQQQAVNAQLLAALEECADDLEAEIRHRYRDLPILGSRYDRDMAPVLRARAAISTGKGGTK